MSTGRRTFLKTASALPFVLSSALREQAQDRPNILLLMSDNHSWNHVGCYGNDVVRTPNIDRVAEEGVRFRRAFCAAPSCAPARAGLLTGQDPWRLEEGANLWGILPDKFPVYTDLLQESGYQIGRYGKGWGPGSVEVSGRSTNHAGPGFGSFDDFLQSSSADDPWCFWYSSSDPHRPYLVGSGVRAGLDPAHVDIPEYLPDIPDVRGDICDYYHAVEQFDQQVGKVLERLRASGEYENTMIIICSDNGWQMPRGLANLYDFGTRIPMIVSWEGTIPGGRVVDDFVNLNDLAPTFLELAGRAPHPDMTARSIANLLFSDDEGQIDDTRDRVVLSRERHALCRQHGLSYPGRAIRTDAFLYIRNFTPDRWPAGDPPLFGDVDAHMLHYPCPTKMHILTNRDHPDMQPFFELGFGKRPAEELYDLREDPDQMNNLAGHPEYAADRERLSARMEGYLQATGDPRVTGGKILWDSTMYYATDDFKPRPGTEAINALNLQEEYDYFG
jgi:arylsulfatase A-like enzyme